MFHGDIASKQSVRFALRVVALSVALVLSDGTHAHALTQQVREYVADRDSFLRQGAPHTNEGANARLRIQDAGNNRVVLAFRLTGIVPARVTRATLVLSLAENADNWGRRNDRTVEAHPLVREFAEGNGKNAEVPGPGVRGDGPGVTWACGVDSDIANQRPDCPARWSGGEFGPATAAPVVHFNGLAGPVAWDVTADVKAGAAGWVIKKSNEALAGRVAYYSREGAQSANPALAPRLILEVDVSAMILWQDEFDAAAGQDAAEAMAAGHGRVVAVGSIQNIAGNRDFVVRTYTGDTGALRWQDSIDVAGGDDTAFRVVLDDRRVIVVGVGTDVPEHVQPFVRAYEAESGMVVWHHQLPDGFLELAMTESQVIVISPGSVRVYQAEDGMLLRDDTSSSLAQGTLEGPKAVIDGGRVFTVKTVLRPDLRRVCRARGYDLATGSLLWESNRESSCRALAAGSDGAHLIVAGQGGGFLDDFLVQAYDATTGTFMWEDRAFITTGFENAAVAVDTEGQRVYVNGWVRWLPGKLNQEAALLRAYDTPTGQRLWEDQYPGEDPMVNRCLCHGGHVRVHRGRVFAVSRDTTRSIWFVRAYDADQGDLLWHDQFPPGNEWRDLTPVALEVDGGQVYLAGSGPNAAGDVDFVLRAYSAE